MAVKMVNEVLEPIGSCTKLRAEYLIKRECAHYKFVRGNKCLVVRSEPNDTIPSATAPRVKASENRTAARYGGQRQIRSGAIPGISNKGDIRCPEKFRIEQKDPQTEMHTIAIANLNKLWKCAITAGEDPIYLINFPPFSVAIIPSNLFNGNEVAQKTARGSLRVSVISLWSELAVDKDKPYISLKTPNREYSIIREEDLCL